MTRELSDLDKLSTNEIQASYNKLFLSFDKRHWKLLASCCQTWQAVAKLSAVTNLSWTLSSISTKATTSISFEVTLSRVRVTSVKSPKHHWLTDWQGYTLIGLGMSNKIYLSNPGKGTLIIISPQCVTMEGWINILYWVGEDNKLFFKNKKAIMRQLALPLFLYGAYRGDKKIWQNILQPSVKTCIDWSTFSFWNRLMMLWEATSTGSTLCLSLWSDPSSCSTWS